MKFCTKHWADLKAAISERGLDSLVAKDGAQATDRMVSELNEGTSKANFDPLMAAHNAIVNRVLSIGGMGLFEQNSDGSERCPLCWGQSEHDSMCTDPNCSLDLGATWIPSCADAMRKEAVRLGLMGGG